MKSVFDSVHTACQEQMAQAAATARQGGWLPPSGWRGQFVLESSKERAGEFQDGTKYAALDCTFKVLDGEFEGRSFQQSFLFTGEAREKPSGAVINLCNLASCVSGETVADFRKGIAIVQAGAGAAIAGSTKSSKDGKHLNVYYNKRVDQPS